MYQFLEIKFNFFFEKYISSKITLRKKILFFERPLIKSLI